MHKTLKIIVIALAFVMIIGVCSTDARTKQKRRVVKKERKVKESKKEPTCALEMVKYSFSGMMLSRVSTVCVERKNGKVVILTEGDLDEGESFNLTDGENLLKEAEKIILEENMLDYAENYMHDPSVEILDGHSWRFEARFNDGRTVSSFGHNAGPGGGGLGRIHTLLFDKANELIRAKYKDKY